VSDETPLEDELLAEREGLERRALDALIELDFNDDRPERAMQALGVEVRNPELLRLALVHRSYLNERGAGSLQVVLHSNERLEYLGDALIGFMTAEYLYRHYPRSPEGDLTAYRAALVRTETLAEWARGCGLHELVYVAHGEVGPDGELRPRLLAGVFEAVLGALYLDRGMRVVKSFLHARFAQDAERIIGVSWETNYKGRLQELVQNRQRATPSYRTLSASGPAHDRAFVVEVVLRGEALGSGAGMSKRSAQQAAARDALERLAREGVVEEAEPDDRSV
jgi:ribonuclease III